MNIRLKITCKECGRIRMATIDDVPVTKLPKGDKEAKKLLAGCVFHMAKCDSCHCIGLGDQIYEVSEV